MMIDEGPTNGTTFKFFLWAIATISAPGSATAGHPASAQRILSMIRGFLHLERVIQTDGECAVDGSI